MENIAVLFKEYFINLTSSEWAWDLVGLNLLLVTFLLFLFKFKLGWFAGVSVREEIAEKDNPAFGLVLASSFLSFFLVMSAATTGDDVISYSKEMLLMISYGLSGMVMILLSRLVFDKITMKEFCINEQLRNRNMAAATIDGGNMVATALILFSYMAWVKGVNLTTIIVVVYGWVISQILLSLINVVRSKMYKGKEGESLSDAIKLGNLAVAFRYTSYKLAVAFSPLIAAQHYEFDESIAFWQATEIFISSVLLSTLFVVITLLVKKMIITGVDFKDEINNQKNTGMAFIEGSIVLGLAILSYGLLK